MRKAMERIENMRNLDMSEAECTGIYFRHTNQGIDYKTLCDLQRKTLAAYKEIMRGLLLRKTT